MKRALLFTFGGILAAYSSAAWLLRTHWRENLSREALLCRFHLCNTEAVASEAQRQQNRGPQGLADLLVLRRALLARQPHSPYAWADLAEALAASGDQTSALLAIRQAEEMAPHWPVILVRAANFYLNLGRAQEALARSARVLSLTDAYDRYVFSLYLAVPGGLPQVLASGLPGDPRPARAFLLFLIQSSRAEEAAKLWEWIEERQWANDELVNRYAGFLLAQGQPAAAQHVWSRQYQARSGGYGKTHFVFNGGFEDEFTGGPFDWSIRPSEGVQIARDSSERFEGKWSLRLDFLKTQNVTRAGASQTLVVPPGAYRFQAWLRSEKLTTDQGVFVRLRPRSADSGTEAQTPALLGSNEWRSAVAEIRVRGPQPAVYELEVARNPSLKFDRLLGGSLWIDAVELQPAGP